MSKRGKIEMEKKKEKKTFLQFLKQRNFFIVFFGCSFDFASQI
jgi:hypothetical protein